MYTMYVCCMYAALYEQPCSIRWGIHRQAALALRYGGEETVQLQKDGGRRYHAHLTHTYTHTHIQYIKI